jgi:hypothetical protein
LWYSADKINYVKIILCDGFKPKMGTTFTRTANSQDTESFIRVMNVSSVLLNEVLEQQEF